MAKRVSEFYAHGRLITLHFSTKHQSEIQTFAKTWAPNTGAVPKADNFTTTSLFGRPFVKRFALCYRTVVCVICHVLSVCDVVELSPNGLMDQDATWYGGRPRPRRRCVRWGPSSLPLQRDTALNFQPMSIVAKRLNASGYHLVQK